MSDVKAGELPTTCFLHCAHGLRVGRLVLEKSHFQKTVENIKKKLDYSKDYPKKTWEQPLTDVGKLFKSILFLGTKISDLGS